MLLTCVSVDLFQPFFLPFLSLLPVSFVFHVMQLEGVQDRAVKS
jgi:hypothetical protein